MCKLKSAIILKDKIFMPDYDSHSKMLEELGITDDYINASKVFVRAELSPENEDIFSDIDGWKFSVDQDITPEWFDEKDCAERMRNTVKEWAKTHIFIGQNGLAISHGENIFIKDCKNVDIYGKAMVKYICGNTTVKNIYDSATVEYIYGKATVEYIYGKATVEYICGSTTVENIYDNATVERIYGNATVENIYGNATVKYIYGNATVESICDNATVERIYGNATVENIYGDATVISSPYTKWNNSTSMVIDDNATFKDCYSKMIYQAGGWEFVKVTRGK